MNVCRINPDMLRYIAVKLPLHHLHNFCLVSNTCENKVCQDNTFWKLKYVNDNPDDNQIPEDNKWKTHYQIAMQTLYYIRKSSIREITRAVIAVSCGYSHTGFMTTTRNFYLRGSNELGQVGLPGYINKSGTRLVQSNIKWFLCKYNYTFYIDENSNCYFTGNFGTPIYGFTLLAGDVIEAYGLPDVAHKTIAYIDANSDLHLTSDFPMFAHDLGTTDIIVAPNVKTICHGRYPLCYITHDLELYLFNARTKTTFLVISGVTKFFSRGELSVCLYKSGNLFIDHKNWTNKIKLSNNVRDFEIVECNQSYSLAYVTNDDDLYISGYTLFQFGIFPATLFNWLLGKFQDQEWFQIRQILINNPEDFPLPNIDDLTDENIKEHLLNLPYDKQKALVYLLPIEIKNIGNIEGLLYPVLLSTNIIKFSLSFNVVHVVKREKGTLRRRKYL